MGKLFGSNGVRGVANKDFTLELAECLASSAGSLLGKEIAVLDGVWCKRMILRLLFFGGKREVLGGLISGPCVLSEAGG